MGVLSKISCSVFNMIVISLVVDDVGYCYEEFVNLVVSKLVLWRDIMLDKFVVMST